MHEIVLYAVHSVYTSSLDPVLYKAHTSHISMLLYLYDAWLYECSYARTVDVQHLYFSGTKEKPSIYAFFSLSNWISKRFQSQQRIWWIMKLSELIQGQTKLKYENLLTFQWTVTKHIIQIRCNFAKFVCRPLKYYCILLGFIPSIFNGCLFLF